MRDRAEVVAAPAATDAVAPEAAAARRAGARSNAGSKTRAIHATVFVLVLACAAFLYWMSRDMAGGMEMPGGWTMGMAWMPMGGQTWLAAGLMFVAMWLAMMVAMMLPSMLPMLLLYRATLAFRNDGALKRKLWLAGTGYFSVWTAFGLVAFAGGVVATQAAMASDAVARAVPILAGLALVVAGIYQLTPAKSACLSHCRNPVAEITRHAPHGKRGAFALGLHHGAWCAGCCWGIMLVQLAIGVMSLPAMAALTLWIAAEKLLPAGPALGRAGGALAIVAGLAMVWLSI